MAGFWHALYPQKKRTFVVNVRFDRLPDSRWRCCVGRLCLAFIFNAPLLQHHLHAATWWVATSGSDTNSLTTSLMRFTDPASTNLQRRFHRAEEQ
jgi:hypothetical protein